MKGKNKKDISMDCKGINAKREKAARDALVNWLDYEKMMVEAAGAAAGAFYPKNNLR